MSTRGTTAAEPGAIRPWRPLGAGARTLRDRRVTVVRPWMSDRDAGAQGFRLLTDVPESPMVWLQRAPVVLLRTVDARHSWHLAPRVNLYLATSTLGSIAAMAAASLPSPLAASSATGVAGAASMMERRIETAFTRHTRSLLETLVTRRERVSSIGEISAAPLSSPVAAPVPAIAPPGIPPSSSPRRVVSHPHRLPGREEGTRPDHARETRAPERSAPSQPTARTADLQIERIADQVVRTLDHRLIAWRERMGRS
jgi:hypothetical protein